MALGSVLLKAQPVAIPLAKKIEPAEVLADFLESLTRDPKASAPAVKILLDEAGIALRDFAVSREERLRFADGKIRNLFSPFGAALDTFVAGLKDDIAGSAPALLHALSLLIAQLTGAKIAEFLGKFFDIAEKDLGISGEALRGLATGIVTRAVTRMKHGVIHGDTSDAGLALYDFGCSLDGLAQMIGDEIEVPGLDVEVLLDAIRKHWQQAGIDQRIAQVQQILTLGEDLVAPLTAFAEIVIDVNIRVSVGGVGANGVAGAEVEVEVAQNPDDPIAWYASWVAGKVVRFPAGDFDNPYLLGFSYKHADAPTMEKVAFHSAWAASAVEAFLHMISAEQGDLAENLMNLGANGLDIGLVAFDKPKLLEQVNFLQPRFLRFMTFMASNFLAGLEGARFGDSNDPYAWTNLGGDMGEAVLYRRWSWLLRETLLSFMTLHNHDPEAFRQWQQTARTNMPDAIIQRAVKHHNNNCFDGMCYFMAELGGMLLPLILWRTDRANYGFIGGGMPASLWGKAIGGSAISWSFMYLSILLARIPAGEFPSDWWRFVLLPLKERVYGEYKLWPTHTLASGDSASTEGVSAGEGALYILKDLVWDVPRAAIALLMYVVDFGIYHYLFTDGSTDDGEYCYDTLGVERQFMGYPGNSDASPYRLPWAGDTMIQCVQGNMGIWSHYPQGVTQTYAYDFGHDKGTEVLCARAGILVSALDIYPDNNPNNWNSVIVLHLMAFPPGATAPSGVTPLAAVAAPVGVTTFADGVTPIPGDALFPPYWVLAGTPPVATTPLAGMPNPVPLHPSAAILPSGALSAPACYAGLTGFPVGTTFAFIDPAYDRAIAGMTLPAGVNFSDSTAIPAGAVFAPGTVIPPAPGSNSPAGTTYLPPTSAGGAFTPLLATFSVYGHALNGFMQISTAPASPPVTGVTTAPRPDGLPDIYRSRIQNITLSGLPASIPGVAGGRLTLNTNAIPAGITGDVLASNNTNLVAINTSEVLGLFVQQGQPVMLSGDTGISAYNHLHTQVIGTVGGSLTLPFVYADAVHDMRNGFREATRGNGVPRAMTFYVSKNTRIGPS